MSIVAQHRTSLQKVFGKYAARNSPVNSQKVVLADVLHLARAASIIAPGTPGKLTAKEVRCAYADSLADGGVESLWQGEAAVAGTFRLDFDSFVECLCRCAVSKLAASHSETAPATVDAAAPLVAEVLGECHRANLRGAFDALGGKEGAPQKGAPILIAPQTLPSLTTAKPLHVRPDETDGPHSPSDIRRAADGDDDVISSSESSPVPRYVERLLPAADYL
jgi:hypothetical protein